MRKILAVLISSVLFLSAFTACSNSSGTKNKGYDIAKNSSSVINANSEFAFDIFKKLNSEDSDKNVFISPLSISTALTMTYNGAESTTKEAMNKALRFEGIDRDEVNKSYSSLLKYLENIDKKVELNIANSIWIREGEKIKEDFLSNNKKSFNAETNNLDFSKDFAAGTINKWISDATKGKIDKMIEPPISPDVIMYLINGIYFKGAWNREFDPKKTFDGTFTTLDSEKQDARMMSQKGKMEYAKGENYQAVRLPYGNGSASMYCILPDESVDINEFIQDITIQKWDDVRKKIAEVDDVILQIPKFKLEYGIKNLNDSLKSLGMEEAFNDTANFSGIREDVYISRVLHKAVIEVNEEGSEAAAATVVEIRETAYREPISFIADRPFIFIIADDTTGTILFMGKLLSMK